MSVRTYNARERLHVPATTRSLMQPSPSIILSAGEQRGRRQEHAGTQRDRISYCVTLSVAACAPRAAARVSRARNRSRFFDSTMKIDVTQLVCVSERTDKMSGKKKESRRAESPRGARFARDDCYVRLICFGNGPLSRVPRDYRSRAGAARVGSVDLSISGGGFFARANPTKHGTGDV